MKNGLVEFLESRTEGSENRIDEKARPASLEKMRDVHMKTIVDEKDKKKVTDLRAEGKMALVKFDKDDSKNVADVKGFTPEEIEAKGVEFFKKLSDDGYYICEK